MSNLKMGETIANDFLEKQLDLQKQIDKLNRDEVIVYLILNIFVSLHI